jgi:predicted DNA-binding protein
MRAMKIAGTRTRPAEAKKQSVLFRVDPELWIRLKVVAARQRSTLQGVLTEAVESYLITHEDGGKDHRRR